MKRTRSKKSRDTVPLSSDFWSICALCSDISVLEEMVCVGMVKEGEFDRGLFKQG